MKVLLKVLVLICITSHSLLAENCEIKLLPKWDMLLVITNYKSERQIIKTTSFDDCKNTALDKLKKANAPKKFETLEEALDDYWASWYEPEYFKGVKAKFTNQDGKIDYFLHYGISPK